MEKKLTIKDLSKQLQVSSATISFVINGLAKSKGISEGLEQKILKHIEAVGYNPNSVARSLRTGKSNNIAMLIEDLADPFFATIAREVEKKAKETGYHIFYASTENNTEHTKALIKIFK